MRELGVSLGKVNFLITSLSRKGLIKLKRFKSSHNKRGYLYVITPKGIMEKMDITMKFLEKKLEEYGNLEKEINSLKNEVNGSKEEKEEQWAGKI